MRVLKFGGSSIGGARQIRQVVNIIKERAKPGDVIVESAIGIDIYGKEKTKVTDLLISAFEYAKAGMRYECWKTIWKIVNRHYSIINALGLDRKIIKPEVEELNWAVAKRESSPKWLDYILSFGERMATKIVAAALQREGVKAEAFNSYDVGFVTDSNFGHARPLPSTYESIKKNFRFDGIAVVTGFVGKDLKGNITTLGRGGSDYSAAIFAAALSAECLEIWSDVNGIKTADPKIVPSAKTIEVISYDEAKELAYYGAKLHPGTIWPVMAKGIPVYIFNTFNPHGPYTKIVKHKVRTVDTVKAIMCRKGNYVININSPKMVDEWGFLAKICDIFGKYQTSVDLISTSEANVSVTIKDPKNLKEIVKELKLIDDEIKVTIDGHKAIICVVGEGMKHIPGIAGKVFATLGKNNINVELISQGASEINISFVVDEKDAENAVRVLHEEYFDKRITTPAPSTH